MLNKYQSESRKEIQIISIEDLVPANHILRDIDRAINFDFIYEEVKVELSIFLQSENTLNFNTEDSQAYF
jgi:hypothetical protein